MQSGSHLDDHLKWISVLWSIFVTFWSLISAITEKVKLEILLRQRAILFSVNFQLIPLSVWSYSNQSIGIFDSRHDLYLVLRVPQSVYPNQVCLISLIWFDTAFGLLFVLIYLMIISSNIDEILLMERQVPSQKGRKLVVDKALPKVYWMQRKILLLIVLLFEILSLSRLWWFIIMTKLMDFYGV